MSELGESIIRGLEQAVEYSKRQHKMKATVKTIINLSKDKIEEILSEILGLESASFDFKVKVKPNDYDRYTEYMFDCIEVTFEEERAFKRKDYTGLSEHLDTSKKQ